MIAQDRLASAEFHFVRAKPPKFHRTPHGRGIETASQREARKYAGVSGAQFMRRHDRGEYCDQLCDLNIAWLLMLEPFWRDVRLDLPSPCRKEPS